MKRIIFLLCYAIAIVIKGQGDQEPIYKNQVKISPVRLLTPVSGLQLSYERTITKKMSTQLTAAYLFDLRQNEYANVSNTKGLILGLEQKYFLKKTKGFGNYVAADLTFVDSRFTTIQSYYIKFEGDEFNTFYDDTVRVKKKTYTFSFKYGCQFYIKCLVIDLNMGAGLRYRDVTHKDKLHEEGKIDSPMEPNAWHELFKPGQYVTFNIPVGFKIGYLF